MQSVQHIQRLSTFWRQKCTRWHEQGLSLPTRCFSAQPHVQVPTLKRSTSTSSNFAEMDVPAQFTSISTGPSFSWAYTMTTGEWGGGRGSGHCFSCIYSVGCCMYCMFLRGGNAWPVLSHFPPGCSHWKHPQICRAPPAKGYGSLCTGKHNSRQLYIIADKTFPIQIHSALTCLSLMAHFSTSFFAWMSLA